MLDLNDFLERWETQNTIMRNDDEEFNKLPKVLQDKLISWICGNLRLIKTQTHSAYELKQMFQKSSHGFYINQWAFAGAMKKAGWTEGRNRWQAVQWHEYRCKIHDLAYLDCYGQLPNGRTKIRYW